MAFLSAIRISRLATQNRLHCRPKYVHNSSQGIRWCRAIDVPTTKPRNFNYKPSKDPVEFEPFGLSDSQRLEEAFQNHNSSNSRTVAVETDGLVSVNLETMLCHPTFWEGPAYQVRRGVWFERLGPSRLVPVTDTDADTLEKSFKNRNLVGILGNGEEVIFDHDHSPVLAQTREKKWTAALRDFKIPASRKFQRGFDSKIHSSQRSSVPSNVESESLNNGLSSSRLKSHILTSDKGTSLSMDSDPNLTSEMGSEDSTKQLHERENDTAQSKSESRVRPSFTPRKITQLLLCVHGIGQFVSKKYEFVNFVKDIEQFRGALGEALGRSRQLQQFLGSKTNTFTEAIPILWRNSLPDIIPGPENRSLLKGLQPQALFGQENLLADVVLDFIMYTEPHYREAIIETTANAMNDAVERFQRVHRYDRQDIQISIVGHSLGGVIVNDLLQSKDGLKFPVKNFFMMGSPLGVLRVIQGSPYSMTGIHTQNIYNILRPSDPVAARLEPVVNPEALEYSALAIPGSSKSLLETLKDFGDELTERGAVISSGASEFWHTLGQQFASKGPLAVTDSDHTESKAASAIAAARFSGNPGWLSDNHQQATSPHSAKEPSSDVLDDLRPFNRHGRLDFKVMEGMDLSLLVGIAGHLMYFDNRDVAEFILKEIHQAPVKF